MSMLRRILAIATLAAAAALAAAPAAAQSTDRQQHEASGDAFYYRGTGGVPPG